MPKLFGLDENLNRAGDTVRKEWQRGKISLFRCYDTEKPPRVSLNWDHGPILQEQINITPTNWETLHGEAKSGA